MNRSLSSENNRPSTKYEPTSNKATKRVTFSRDGAMIKMISSRKEYTEEEQCAYWYGEEEYNFKCLDTCTNEADARRRALQLERILYDITSPGRWSPKSTKSSLRSSDKKKTRGRRRNGEEEDFQEALDTSLSSLSSSPPEMPERRDSTCLPMPVRRASVRQCCWKPLNCENSKDIKRPC